MGCTIKQQIMTEEVAGSTEIMQYTTATTEIDIDLYWLTTVLPPTFKASVMTFTEKDLTVRVTTRRRIFTTAKAIDGNLGFSNREIIVYSICAGGFVFVILLCTVCQRRYKQIYGNFRRYKTGKKRRRNIPEVSLPEIPLESSEGIYEIIDDSNMIDNFETTRKRRSLVSNIDESYCEPNSNGYLTPYQPVEEFNTNGLDDNKTVSSDLIGTNDQVTDDGESTPSSSEVQDRSSYLNPYQPIVHSADIHEYSSTHNMNDSSSSDSESITRESSYLNPYQPIVHSADIHEYSSTHNMNESSSSGSDSIPRESGYLNPYQPMVPDRDLHDYKSVPEFSDESGSVISDECTKEIDAHSYQDLKSEIDTHEYKSVSSMLTDTVETDLDLTEDDCSKNIRIKTENEYLQME